MPGETTGTHQERVCNVCGGRSPRTSVSLGVCSSCIRDVPERALRFAAAAHQASRRSFRLPVEPPRDPGGVDCTLCARECSIGEDRRGFCNLRTCRDGRIAHLAGTSRRGLLRWYRDPLPTNCVADWVCSGHRRTGQHNLAVFYESCTLNCLFCQNWHFRNTAPLEPEGMSADELAAAADDDTYCVCFFGGDPASQIGHAITAARRLAERGVVVCWETAGTTEPRVLDHAVELSRRTGGCIKFDLKAYNEPLHVALTGASNWRTLENFERAVGNGEGNGAGNGGVDEDGVTDGDGREENGSIQDDVKPNGTPPVVASTLLVPGYVDADEVSAIASFIAKHDRDVPYALLGFAPQFYMSDLPPTSLEEAREAVVAAREAGLSNVRVGNLHLMG